MNIPLRSSFYLRTTIVLIAVTAGSCVTKRQGQTLAVKTTSTAAGSIATAALGPGKKEGIMKFSDLIPSKTKVNKGLFNTYKVDGKYYYEIPDSLIGREMLVITRLAKTPAGIRIPFNQYGGEEQNEQVWKWEKHDKQILIRVLSYSITADSTTDMYRSVKNSNLDVVLASFDIKAYNNDTTGVIIEVSDFYNGDITAIGISDALKRAYKISGLDNSRSFIDTIKTLPINIETRVLKTYRAIESPTDNTTGAVSFELNTSMLLLSKAPMKARLSDDRVGYFGQKWGYTWFPVNETPKQEKEILDEWVKVKAGNSLYYFGREGTLIDPRLQTEDLGDIAMKASGYGIANLKRILPNIEKWTYQKGQKFDDLEDLYNGFWCNFTDICSTSSQISVV
jgi:hypothetical protein